MKKYALIMGIFAVSASSLFAANGNGNNKKPANGSSQMQMQMPDCSSLSPNEQNFANQLNDMNNRSMFCSQFTPQQRQQAMQMMGQPDASGNMMSADQAVQQVMGSTPSNQRRTRPGGGCPVK